LHFWEEPPISGTRGSGAVFFSGCNLRCVFCQNHAISHVGYGKEIGPERLRAVFEDLIAQGAHNINLVTPTHLTPWLLPALRPKLPVPVVWNCGGYEHVETLRSLEGLVDIYLPDVKCMLPGPAARYLKAPDYPERVIAAVEEMYRQAGDCVFDGDGILQKGVMVRHLVLPGNLENSRAVIDWFVDFKRGKKVLFSLMSQYVPLGEAARYPEINRRLTEAEYADIRGYMLASGIEDGFYQDLDAADEGYVPPFDLTGIP